MIERNGSDQLHDLYRACLDGSDAWDVAKSLISICPIDIDLVN